MSHFVELKDVTKTYRMGETAVDALSGMSFEIEEGELVVILGPSGAGKTTLLNLLGGMDTLTSGEISVAGVSLAKLNSRQLTMFRRHDVGFVFQFYNLMPNLTARENIELATEICKNAMSPDEALKLVGLTDRAGNFPAQLSGGEQQRVSIARAVAKNPKILLCDEPTGALDYGTGKLVLGLLRDMCRDEKKTVIIVTHNSALKDMADRVVYIKNGKAEKVEINSSPKAVEDIEW
ncbi:MAG: ABC transporter ATP-binding protein [Christensenellales bacterium]|nr:ABC transporter ATP-binding protein [Clostridia bacterium]